MALTLTTGGFPLGASFELDAPPAPESKFIFDGPTMSIYGKDSFVSGGVFEFTTVELYNAWLEWVVQDDNLKYQPAFRTSGGDPIGGGVSIGFYLFIRNDLGWVGHPPNSGDVQVIIDGNLYPEDPGLPFFDPWAGATTVIQMRNSSLTQAIVTGGSSGPTANEIASAVRTNLTPELSHIMTLENNPGLTNSQATMLLELYNIMGLDPTKPLYVSNVERTVPGIKQVISTDADRTILTRIP